MAKHLPSKSSTVRLTYGEISYVSRSRIEHIVSSGDITTPTTPAVVVHLRENDPVTLSYVQSILDTFGKTDDVYTSQFAEHAALVLLHEHDQPPHIDDALDDFLKGSIPRKLFFEKVDSSNLLLEGPYFLQGKELHQSWRLYPDYLSAFTTSIIPDDEKPGWFTPLKVTSHDGFDLAVAVPSRLYFPQSLEKPLNGLRVSVKDNYHVAGTVTTLGSRSYGKLYGVQDTTSTYVKRLLELGCIIVGKTKLSSFAGTEVPPKGPIDYSAPFGPRADLYQSPAGSSMGAACAISGYEWLDVSLATDTTGSTRAPAASAGVWALRPTWGSLPMEGIVRSVELFDTVGLMACDSNILHHVHQASIEEAPSEQKLPTQILYPTDWFPASNEKHQEMVDAFTSILEQYLGVARTEISLSDLWLKTAPEDAQGETLKDYVAKIGYHINMWDGYHNFADFREQYEKKFNEAPYISPVQTSRWASGREVTPEQRAEAVKRRQIFIDWIKQHVIRDDQSTVMVVWYGSPEPAYRDEVTPSAPNRFPGSYNPNFFTTILGLPNVIIPVGHVPFTSRVTQRIEYLPAVAGLIGGPGMDEVIIRVSRDALKKAGCPTNVLPGRLAFNLEAAPLVASGEAQEGTTL